ncbi:hypothetical protein CKO28_17645 [Rhodovibrio sodomensis]|uniref:Protein kinase domain-containing protein n=1 Tax=Rhodovibrio sodomensis TaxID=1088 RepID=A0ABS1DJG4_9PROT|nr:hypothetical protein [Rhodovibrio sodomensis]MBK1669863.1 hypothetical protein [Rhodovibrio sodomensis]
MSEAATRDRAGEGHDRAAAVGTGAPAASDAGKREQPAADKTSSDKAPGDKAPGDKAPGDRARADTAQAGKPGARGVALGKYITIDTGVRLPHLDRPTALAYGASDSRTPTEQVFVLVCDPQVPPRLDALHSLAKLRGVPLMIPVDWGPVAWGEGGQRRYAICYDRPVDPVLAPVGGELPQLREDQLIERILRPLFRTFRELYARGLTHRAVCASNLYLAEGGNGACLLGECASAPAGMTQPAVYEPIDAGQALAVGRGSGALSDDLYALGVLMALILRGQDPFQNSDPAAIAAQKISKGSYAAIMGQARVSLTLMEPLRGLLCDRIDERWSLHQLEIWLNGRRQSPKQPSLPTKARRAFNFQGRDYWTAPALSHALATNWQDALRVLSSGELERWAERSLADEKQSKQLAATLASAQAGDGGDDRALARALVALDPAAPIRLREFAARIDAIPQALALGFDDRDRRTAFVEVLRSKLPQRWLEAQPQQRPDHPQVLQQFERMLWYIERDQPGYGMERVLYEYNSGWPCQSPLLAGSYVSEMEDLLPALERRAEQDVPDSAPIDRHIAAFCGANMKPAPDRMIQGLGDPNPANRAQATVTLLADLQRRYGPTQLPALCEWMARRLAPLTESLHNRHVREKVNRRIERAVKSGSLAELRAAAAGSDLRQRDQQAFAHAKAQYAQLARDIAWLEEGGLTSPASIARATRSVATAASAIAAGLIVVVATIVYVT